MSTQLKETSRLAEMEMPPPAPCLLADMKKRCAGCRLFGPVSEQMEDIGFYRDGDAQARRRSDRLRRVAVDQQQSSSPASTGSSRAACRAGAAVAASISGWHPDLRPQPAFIDARAAPVTHDLLAGDHRHHHSRAVCEQTSCRRRSFIGVKGSESDRSG